MANPMPPTIDLRHITILIVDDNPFICRMVRTVLHGFGVGMVYEASNAGEATGIFARSSPSIVITDCEMPNGDGLALVASLRDEATSANPFVPIIMLTAHTERSRMLRARNAGVNEIIRKPMSVQALYARIYSVVACPRQFIRTEGYFGPEQRYTQDNDKSDHPAAKRSPRTVIYQPVDNDCVDTVMV